MQTYNNLKFYCLDLVEKGAEEVFERRISQNEWRWKVELVDGSGGGSLVGCGLLEWQPKTYPSRRLGGQDTALIVATQKQAKGKKKERWQGGQWQ